MENSLALYIQQFEESEQATQDSRGKAERDRDYYDEKQWTATEKAALEKRGQPAVTFNRVKRKVNAMMGIEKQTRKDPKAFPRNPDDDAAAQAATDVIRYVCEDSRWDDKRSECAKELAIEGTCAVMVGVKQAKDGIDPEIRRIPWDRFYYDPHSGEFDFNDAAYMGVVIWMDLDQAVAKYPDAKDILEATWSQARDSETYDDRPKYRLWADYKRRRVRLCEHYSNGPEGWKFCIFTRGGYVVESQPSPYLGEDKQPECPIKAVSLYIDRDNNRYGEVRTMIGPQDEINKRRSKALHLISQRQMRVSRGASLSPQEVRKEASRPDGVFIADPGEVEVLQTNDMASANLAMLQEAKNEIDLLGPNAALQGKNEAAMSGRAIQAQAQGGMTESATYLDRIRTLSLAVYRSAWYRVQQFWDGARWVRVTDNDQNLRFVGVNQPVTMIQQAAQQMGITKDNVEQMRQEAPGQVAMLEQMAQDPQAQQIVQVENQVTELDVDITVDEGIDTPTIAAEQFDTMAKMLPSAPPNLQAPLWKALLQNSAFRNKDELLKAFDQPEPDPMQQQMMQLQTAGAQAEVEKTQSETAKNMAATQEIMAGIQMDAFTTGQQAAL